MANANAPLYAFNRGLVSPLGLARVDQKRMALSAQVQTNFMPRLLGSMMLRPGTQYLGASNNNARAKFLPFIFSNDDLGLLEFTDSTLRIWLGIGSDEAPISRSAVATVITNGDFSAPYQSVVTISIATPAVITWSNHGLAAGAEVSFFSTGSLPTGITVDATYYVRKTGLTTNTFQISASAPNETVTLVDESDTVPSSAPYQITVANSNAYIDDFGVVDTTGPTTMTKELPGASLSSDQYSHVGGLYSFSSAQSGVSVSISYSYTAFDGAAINTSGSQSGVQTGNANGGLAGWTNADQSGAASNGVDGVAWGFPAADYMQLAGTGFNAGIEYQEISVASGDRATEHGLRIVVKWGVVHVRVGTSVHDDSILNDRALGTGTHSIAFTPNAANVYLEFRNALTTPALVQSVAIESAGIVTLPTPWPLGVLASPCLLRVDQSGDVIYVACQGYQQRKITRTYGSTGPRSWSIELFQPLDGPFLLENTGSTTITPSGTTGLITLAASDNLFYSGHVGALFRLASIGQTASVAAAGTSQWSAAVQVNGIGSTERNLAIKITGTWVATVQLQMSVGSPGAWVDVTSESWTSNVATTYYDGLDNQIIYYRIGIESAYTSGTATCSLTFTTGTIQGIVQITAVTSAKAANAIVLTEPNPTSGTTVLSGLGSTAATANWWEGQWSDYQGWPTACALYQGRLWNAGKDACVGSISDAYESYDDTQQGDSAPINTSVGSGPVDIINWLLPLYNLVLGGQGSEISAVSSTFDTPLTVSDFMLLYIGTIGSGAIPALKVDYNGLFIDRTFRRLYELSFSPNFFMFNYTAKDLTNFVPDIAITENGALLSAGGFSMIAVQRRPDTRIHAVLNDGTVRVLIRDPDEDEQCWVKVALDGGTVEDIVVLPGPVEDYVYYVVNRTVNGATVRYLERWAREDECWGASISKCADCHVVYQGEAIKTMTLPQLPNTAIVVWADGLPIGSATTDGGGNFTMPDGLAHSNIVAGVGYTAQYQSTKLAYAAQLGTPLSQRKRAARVGLILANAHCKGIQYGPDFNTLRDLPQIVGGAAVAPNTIYTAFDEPMIELPSKWSTDARLCLQSVAPYPVTVLAAIIDMETREAA